LKLFLKPSGYSGSAPFTGREPGSNGLAYDANGQLVLCQHGNRQIARLEKDGGFKTLADRYQGKRFNSPNDLAYRANGDLYFTDPAYGLPKTFDDPGREVPWAGVYRLSGDGVVTLLVQHLLAPNGIAFSPDEKTLYVAQSHPAQAVVMAYDVQADGTVKGGRIFFDMTPWVGKDRPGLPDGLKLDRAGNLFVTGPGGVHVLTPKAEHLGTIATGVPTANCGFGEDGSTLFVTANTTLCRIRLTTQGAGY
jgi:gluconolactonase